MTVKTKSHITTVNCSDMASLWNSTNVTYLVFTNSAVWLAPSSFSVQGFLPRWNVSYLSKCIDLKLLRFLRYVFLDLFFFIIHLRVSYVRKHCSSFSRSLSLPLLFQSFPPSLHSLRTCCKSFSFMVCYTLLAYTSRSLTSKNYLNI